MVTVAQLNKAEDNVTRFIDTFRSAGELKESLQVAKAAYADLENAQEQAAKLAAEIKAGAAYLVKLHNDIEQAEIKLKQAEAKIAKVQKQLADIGI